MNSRLMMKINAYNSSVLERDISTSLTCKPYVTPNMMMDMIGRAAFPRATTMTK